MTEPKDRLTFDGNFCDIAQCREERWGKYCPDGACSQRKVWERLKEYEDADDVVPVRHGRWEWYTEDIYRCTVCYEKVHVKEVMGRPDWDYCPNCGAKMDVGAD